MDENNLNGNINNENLIIEQEPKNDNDHNVYHNQKTDVNPNYYNPERSVQNDVNEHQSINHHYFDTTGQFTQADHQFNHSVPKIIFPTMQNEAIETNDFISKTIKWHPFIGICLFLVSALMFFTGGFLVFTLIFIPASACFIAAGVFATMAGISLFGCRKQFKQFLATNDLRFFVDGNENLAKFYKNLTFAVGFVIAFVCVTFAISTLIRIFMSLLF